MEGIVTVGEFREALERYDPDLPIQVAVVKYPEEFTLRGGFDTELSWTDSTDVELIMIELDEITQQGPCVTVCVELTDYNEQRHKAGG